MCIKGHYQESEKTTFRMGKIFVHHISQNRLISRIYLKTPTTQQQQNPNTFNLKMDKRLDKHFSKENTQMDNNNVKRASTLLFIRKVQIKTTIEIPLHIH